MEQITAALLLLAGVFAALELLAIVFPRFPKIPGDIYFDKFGFDIYIPFTSAIVLSIIFSILLSFFKK